MSRSGPASASRPAWQWRQREAAARPGVVGEACRRTGSGAGHWPLGGSGDGYEARYDVADAGHGFSPLCGSIPRGRLRRAAREDRRTPAIISPARCAVGFFAWVGDAGAASDCWVMWPRDMIFSHKSMRCANDTVLPTWLETVFDQPKMSCGLSCSVGQWP